PGPRATPRPRSAWATSTPTRLGRRCEARTRSREARATLRVVTVVKVSSAILADTEPTTAGRADRRDLEDVEGEQRVLAEKELRRVASELPGDVPVEVD